MVDFYFIDLSESTPYGAYFPTYIDIEGLLNDSQENDISSLSDS